MNDLRSLLVEARGHGFLGDQEIERQLEHARGFADVCAAVLSAGCPSPSETSEQSREAGTSAHDLPRWLLDLGAGGGLPGLVLATSRWPFAIRVLLLDGSVRRAEWLQYAVDELGLHATAEVIGERAEVVGRLAEWRHALGVVVARSFGRPAVTAECAAPLLSLGGALVVSEPPPVSTHTDGSRADGAHALPPGSPGLEARWPPDKVAELGFGAAVEWRARGCRYAVLRLERLCPDRYPRRNGIPAKRPIF